MRYAPRSLPYTLRCRAPLRPDAGPTVEILTGSGGTIVAAGTAATLSPVSTVLDTPADPGASVLDVTSTSAIANADELLLGPNADGKTEWVTVIGSTSTDVLLANRLRYGYASASYLRGTHISYALTSADTATIRRNCRVIFSWGYGAASQPPLIERFDIVRHWVGHQPATLNDVLLHDARALDRLPPEYDVERGLDRAFSEVLRDLNGARRVGAALCDDDWRDVVALKFLATFVGGAMGERGKPYRERWEARYVERIEILESQTVVDENEDGVIAKTEEGVFGGRTERS